MQDEDIPSPCRAICQLDDEETYCIGCFRTVEEIEHWTAFDREKREMILAELEARRAGVEGGS